MRPPSKEIQEKAVTFIQKTYSEYNTLLNFYRARWFEYFCATYKFEVTDRNKDYNSKIFFPKCFEQVEKVAPRIYGNNPKFVVSLNVPVNNVHPEADMTKNMEAVQKSLNYYWKIGQCQKKGRSWVKGGLVYGIMWAIVKFERITTTEENVEVYDDEEGEQIERTTTVEKVLNEYPTFEVPDIFDVYFDPRVENEEDMSSIVIGKDDVRWSDLNNQKELYFNLDEIKDLPSQAYSSDGGNYKQNKFTTQGIPQSSVEGEHKLNIKRFYGFFSETGDPKDEELVEMISVNDSVLIRYKKIKFKPWVKWNPVEIFNQAVGTGLVEPIEKLQKAYNLTRNQRAENVSLVLNRMWLMKVGAGVDPRKLVSRAGNIIPTKDMDGLQPIQTPDVTQSAFTEANSINSEIQQTLGTIDTTQDQSNNGFTNLATGQKIRWNEFNVRYKAIKQNFEEALARIGEKMLLMVGVEANQNPLVADEMNKQFWEVSKTAFDQVSDFYNISVLPDSTANDSIENKREEVLAFGQLALAYKGQGVPINMGKIWEDIANSFPGRNPADYLEPMQPQPGQPQQGGPIPQKTVDQAQVKPSVDTQLSNDLANV